MSPAFEMRLRRTLNSPFGLMMSAILIRTRYGLRVRESTKAAVDAQESQCSGQGRCCNGRGQFEETSGTNTQWYLQYNACPFIRQLHHVKAMNLMDLRWMSYRKSQSSIQPINTKMTLSDFTNMEHISLHVFQNSSRNSGTIQF